MVTDNRRGTIIIALIDGGCWERFFGQCEKILPSPTRSLGNKADEISRYQTTSNFELPKDTPFLICSINTSCPLIRVINDNFGLLSCFGELSEYNKGVAGGRGGEGRRFFFFFFFY